MIKENADTVLMTGELSLLFIDLVFALDGELADQQDLVTEGEKVAK